MKDQLEICAACGGSTIMLDIGATNVGRGVALRLDIKLDDRPYRLRVYAPDDFAIDTKDPGNSYWHALDMNTGIARRLLGHALRRTICRGISFSEIREDKHHAVVVIDLGEIESVSPTE